MLGRIRAGFIFINLFVILFLATACQSEKNPGQKVFLNGAGATFPYPLYSKWFAEYNKLHPNVIINYQSIGSGGGIQQLITGTVDFGASDMPMTEEQSSRTRVKILHVPTAIGAVVPIYNLSSLQEQLKFTPQILAEIYSGTIKFWDDGSIVQANPGTRLPHQSTIVVHRSDGSGTTFIFTDFLSKTNINWKNSIGAGTSVNWPVGVGAKGNEGIAGLVRQTDGAIGYVELIYATQNNITFGRVKNRSNNFVQASLENVTNAADAYMQDMSDDFKISIVNAPGDSAYPIASFTWLLVPILPVDRGKGKILNDFLIWMLDSGQSMTAALNYAPLPQALRRKIKNIIELIRNKE